MILTDPDIQKILKRNPQQAYMDVAQEKYDVLRMHCSGEGIEVFPGIRKE